MKSEKKIEVAYYSGFFVMKESDSSNKKGSSSESALIEIADNGSTTYPDRSAHPPSLAPGYVLGQLAWGEFIQDAKSKSGCGHQQIIC